MGDDNGSFSLRVLGGKLNCSVKGNPERSGIVAPQEAPRDHPAARERGVSRELRVWYPWVHDGAELLAGCNVHKSNRKNADGAHRRDIPEPFEIQREEPGVPAQREDFKRHEFKRSHCGNILAVYRTLGI